MKVRDKPPSVSYGLLSYYSMVDMVYKCGRVIMSLRLTIKAASNKMLMKNSTHKIEIENAWVI